jgi:hypothetical protein
MLKKGFTNRKLISYNIKAEAEFIVTLTQKQ